MTIFLDDTDYRQFVYLLGEVSEEYRIECWNYCVMPNHYHATLCPSRPNLSAAIRQLNGEYAQWWNRRHGRVGHVFQGRFKDQIVQREGYLLALFRYVAMNPVRAQLCDQPEKWAWSSYAAIVGIREAPAFLAVAATLRQFGEDDSRILRARFAGFVLAAPDDAAAVDRIRSNERILGERGFKEAVLGESGKVVDPLTPALARESRPS